MAATALFYLRPDKWQISAILLINLSLLSDYLDGSVALLQERTSRYGFWLDTILDRTTDFMIFISLAAGASNIDNEGIWFWVSISIGFRFLFDLVRWSPLLAGLGKNVMDMAKGKNRLVSSLFYCRPNLYLLLAIAVVIDEIYYFFVVSSIYGLVFTVALFFYLNRNFRRSRQ